MTTGTKIKRKIPNRNLVRGSFLKRTKEVKRRNLVTSSSSQFHCCMLADLHPVKTLRFSRCQERQKCIGNLGPKKRKLSSPKLTLHLIKGAETFAEMNAAKIKSNC